MSLLTIYRPNFCSECGGKVVRLRWYLWTSRKFCDQCIPRFFKEHWVQPTIAVITLLFTGMLIGRAFRHEPPPLVIQRNASLGASQNVGGLPGAQMPAPDDEVYICGARTKKGTPCSRRVHGPVRCWQHKGVSAILPLDKLIVKD